MRLWASVSNYMMTVILHKLQRSLHSMVHTNSVHVATRGRFLVSCTRANVIDALGLILGLPKTRQPLRETPLSQQEKQTNKGYMSGEETAAMVCARSTGAARKWWNGVYASRFVTFAQ